MVTATAHENTSQGAVFAACWVQETKLDRSCEAKRRSCDVMSCPRQSRILRRFGHISGYWRPGVSTRRPYTPECSSLMQTPTAATCGLQRSRTIAALPVFCLRLGIVARTPAPSINETAWKRRRPEWLLFSEQHVPLSLKKILHGTAGGLSSFLYCNALF